MARRTDKKKRGGGQFSTKQLFIHLNTQNEPVVNGGCVNHFGAVDDRCGARHRRQLLCIGRIFALRRQLSARAVARARAHRCAPKTQSRPRATRSRSIRENKQQLAPAMARIVIGCFASRGASCFLTWLMYFSLNNPECVIAINNHCIYVYMCLCVFVHAPSQSNIRRIAASVACSRTCGKRNRVAPQKYGASVCMATVWPGT